MMSRRILPTFILCAIVLGISVCPHGWAQTETTRRSATATLPESNEALLLSSRARQAISAGDFRLAIELIGQTMALPGGLVAAPGSRTYYPVSRQAVRLLEQLPQRGVDAYRSLYDGAANARFAEARRGNDVAALRELFRTYRLCSAWESIGVELAARLMDTGEFGEAIEVLRRISTSGANTPAEQAAMRIVALARVGATQSAAQLLARIDADQQAQGAQQWQARSAALHEWLDAHGSEHVRAGERYRPRLDRGSLWRQTLVASDAPLEAPADADLAEAIGSMRRLPLQEAAISGDVLVTRLRGNVWAFDPLTLAPRWRADEFQPDSGETELEAFGDAAGDETYSSDTRLLLTHDLRHVVSLGFGKVFTVEALSLFEADSGDFRRRRFGAQIPGRNEMVARDAQTGRVAWRTSTDAAGPLFDVAFQDRPLVLGDRLVAPLRRGQDLHLAVIEPSSGSLLREIPVVGPPTAFSVSGGRSLLIADETTLYVSTGQGVVAAFSREDLSWKWATKYPSALAVTLRRSFWQPPERPIEFGAERPVIAGELLVLAPLDSEEIFALDRFSGRELWRIPRRGYSFLAGAVREGIVLGGHSIACLDASDPLGRPARWRSVPLEITGRPAIRDERIFVPTRSGIVVVDASNGKVIEDESLARSSAPAISDGSASADSGAVGANLLATDTALFSVRPETVVKYPDAAALRGRLASSAAEKVSSDRKALALTWLDVVAGDYSAALAQLDGLDPSDESIAGETRRVAARVYLALARSATGNEERLTWLRRAAASSGSTEVAGQLDMLIGSALEDSGRLPEALEHYGQIVIAPETHIVTEPDDPEHEVAAWLRAGQRISAIDVPLAQRRAFLSDLIRKASGQATAATALQRLRISIRGVDRAALDALILEQDLPPELAIRYLSDSPDRSAAFADRRRAHLRRWEIHVSLGMMDEARADRELWHAQFAGDRDSDPAAAIGSPEYRVRRTVRALERIGDKLDQARGGVFREDFARQWRMRSTELLLNSRGSAGGTRRWIPVRNHESQQIQLIELLRNQQPWAQHPDAMSQGIGAQLAAREARGRVTGGAARIAALRIAAGGMRQAWPIVIHDDLAAVPVRRGLLCLGLGPQRGGGTKIWEADVPGWDEIPRDFERKSAAGDFGVYFAPRPDRVELIGWIDGQRWWRRDLAGTTIDRLYLAGERLVVVGENREVWIFDAATGAQRESLPVALPTPRRIDVIGGMLVAWLDRSAVGFDLATMRQRWTKDLQSEAEPVPVANRPWIAYRQAGATGWGVLDATGGAALFERTLDGVDAINALAVSGDLLLVAAQKEVDGDGQTVIEAQVAAFGASDGAPRWARSVRTRAAVNVTQLAGHPQFVPVLIDLRSGGSMDEDNDGSMAIQLISKRDGSLSEARSIDDDFTASGEAECDVYMFVTPTRMIVQAGQNLIGYGNSILEGRP